MFLLHLTSVSGLSQSPNPSDEMPLIDLKFTSPKFSDVYPILSETIGDLDSKREATEMTFFAERISDSFEKYRKQLVQLVERSVVSNLSITPISFLQDESIPEQQVRVKLIPPDYFNEYTISKKLENLENWRNNAEMNFLKQAEIEFATVFDFYSAELKKQLRWPCRYDSSLLQDNEYPSRIPENLNIRLSLDEGFKSSSILSQINAMEDRRDIVEDNERRAIVRLTRELIKAANDKLREILLLEPVSFLQGENPMNPELARRMRSRLLEKSDIEIDFHAPLETVKDVNRKFMAVEKVEKVIAKHMNLNYSREKKFAISQGLDEMKMLICNQSHQIMKQSIFR